jgi:hypothetical protein
MAQKPNDRLQVAEKAKSPRELWTDIDWQKLWLSLQARPWSSLAFVPASTGASPDFTLRIAVTLARIGIMHLGVPIQVADATRIPLIRLVQFKEELARLKDEGELVLVALSPLADNPVALALAQAADAALLCILLGDMQSSEAKKTVERLGAQRFMGSVMFERDPKGATTNLEGPIRS